MQTKNLELQKLREIELTLRGARELLFDNMVSLSQGKLPATHGLAIAAMACQFVQIVKTELICGVGLRSSGSLE